LDRYCNAWPILGEPRDVRNPMKGDTAPKPYYSPVLDFHPELIQCAGTSWWNWRRGVTEATFLDFDFGHGRHGQDAAGIAQLDLWAKQLPYVSNIASKSGRGRHWYIRLANPLPAKVRPDHLRNCRAVVTKVSNDLGFDITQYACASGGGIQYIYSRRAG